MSVDGFTSFLPVVRLREECTSYREYEYSYSKMTENRQGPTPDVRFIEVSVKRNVTVVHN